MRKNTSVYARTITTAALGMALLGAGPAQADEPTDRPAVCNQVENSPQGAPHLTLGNGVGLIEAASHSPVLAQCIQGGGSGPF